MSESEPQSILQPGSNVRNLATPVEGHLVIKKTICRQSYCDVYDGTLVSSNGADILSVAIKSLKAKSIGWSSETQNEGPKSRFEMIIKREVAVWQSLTHEHILPFCGYQILTDRPLLVTPWCQNGSLRQYVANTPNLSDSTKLRLLSEAARGLSHLHSLDPIIVHGDIHPENILITDEITAVLCDIGISRVAGRLGASPGLTTAEGERGGLAAYISKDACMSEIIQPPSDLYAFGGVVLATMSGRPPFWSIRSATKIFTAIYNDVTPDPSDHPGLSPTDPLWSLLRKLWHSDPVQRPSADETAKELISECERRSFSTQS